MMIQMYPLTSCKLNGPANEITYLSYIKKSLFRPAQKISVLTEISSEARRLNYVLSLHLHLYFVYASSDLAH